MHRDAIAFGLEEVPGQENARGNPDTAVERRPSLRALDRKIQFGPRIRVAERFAHWFAVKAQLRDREHAIGIDPRIRTADGILDFPAPRLGKMRDVVQPQISVASDVTEMNAWNQIEETE